MSIETLIEAAGWTLVHFLWQGLVIAGVSGLVMRFTRQSSTRYTIGAFAMVMFLVSAGATFFRQLPESSEPVSGGLPISYSTIESPTPAPLPPVAAPVIDTAQKGSKEIPFPAWQNWVVLAWLTGVAFFGLRLWIDYKATMTLRKSASPPEGEWETWKKRFASLAEKSGVPKSVPLLTSLEIRVPVVLGVIRPVVIVPSSLLTGLSPAQIEAILLHELAHVKRHDFLVNILQSIVETLFFFHPAVWWISRGIREEREHCCDDRAAKLCDDVSQYATALAALETWRSTRDPFPTLAADGGRRGILLKRIRRLARPENCDSASPGLPALAISGLAILLVILGIGFAMNEAVANEEETSQVFTIRGKVFDQRPGHPAHDYPHGPFSGALVQAFTTLTPDTPVASERSDENGEFELRFQVPRESLRQDIELSIIVSLPGYTERDVMTGGKFVLSLDKRGENILTPGIPGHCVFRMLKAGSIRGTLRDKEGKPIPNIEFGVKIDDNELPWNDGTLNLPGRIADSTRTDSGGRFILTKVPPIRELHLYASRSGVIHQTDAYSLGYQNYNLDVVLEKDQLTCSPSKESENQVGNELRISIVRNHREQPGPADPAAFARKVLTWLKSAQDGHLVKKEGEKGNQTWNQAISSEQAIIIDFGHPLKRSELRADPTSDIYLSGAVILYSKDAIGAIYTKSSRGRIDSLKDLSDVALKQVVEDPALGLENEQWVQALPKEETNPKPILKLEESVRTDPSRVQTWIDDAFQLDDIEKKNRSIESIRQAIQSDNPAAQKVGLEAFTRLGEVSFEKASFHDLLIPLLKSEVDDIRALAAGALVLSGLTEGDHERLLAMTEDPAQSVRQAVAYQIVFAFKKDLTGKAAAAIYQLLLEDDPRFRKAIIRSLWGAKLSPKLEGRIIELSRSKDRSEYYDALYYALSTQANKSEASVKRLIEFLAHQDTLNVAGRAAWGLGQGVANSEKGLVADAALKVMRARNHDSYLFQQSMNRLEQYAGPEQYTGVQEFSTKPGLNQELKARLRKILDRIKPSEKPVAVQGGYQNSWSARGKVTDIEGNGLEGVEIRVHTGMGTLRRTGIAKTDKDGRYTVSFSRGVLMTTDSSNLQVAQITAHFPGYCEKNLSRHGEGVMAIRDITEKKMKGFNLKDQSTLALPGKPREVNFVMVPAVRLEGRLVGSGPFSGVAPKAARNLNPNLPRGPYTEYDNTPLQGWRVWITGKKLPPGSSIWDEATADKNGNFFFENVPVGFEWYFETDTNIPGHRSPRSEIFTLTGDPVSVSLELGAKQEAVKYVFGNQ